MIIHLKRYEQPANGMNSRWIKSHKRVCFPVEDLNMLPYVPNGAHALNMQFARIQSGMEPCQVSKYVSEVLNNQSVPADGEAMDVDSESSSETSKSPGVDDYFKYRLFSVSVSFRVLLL